MAGQPYSFGDGDPRELELPHEWGKERTISGRVLAEMLLRAGAGAGAGAGGPPQVREVRIRGARVTGEVDLSHAEVPLALYFDRCLFEGNLILELVRARTLQLEACVLASLKATGALFEGLLRIRRSDVQGAISLIDATVSQSVVLSGSTIAGDRGCALSADRLTVGGNVFLNRVSGRGNRAIDADAFVAAGEVRLLGARIDGQLNCTGGRVANPEGQALNAGSAQIGGSVYLRDKFHASGEVGLLGARIKGRLDCSRGRFENPDKIALTASSADIGHSVFLTDKFHATGQVRMLSARIGGRLNCSGGRFENCGKTALSASSTNVTQSVFLNNGFHATGTVRLAGVRIGGRLNCCGACIENPSKTALDLQEARMSALLLRGPDLRLAGGVHLFGAKTLTLADDPSALDGQSVTLDLDGFVYERIAPKSPRDVSTRLHWLSRHSEGYYPQPFDQLATVFRRNGQDQEATKVLVEKRRKRRAHLTSREHHSRRQKLQGWLSYLWDAFLDRSVLYGWQPWRPLLLGGAFFLIGIVLVSVADAAGHVDNFAAATLPYISFIHALDVFLPIVDLGVESRWQVDTSNDDAFAWVVTWYLWALKLMGWATVTLAVAALTGIVKRD